MTEINETDIEIIDTEHYKGDKAQKFSHSAIVMAALRKCLDMGSKEMTGGYYNYKYNSNGDETKVWVSDTREVFIETVNTTEDLMKRDLDDEYYKRKDKIISQLAKKYKELVERERIFWDNLNIAQLNYQKSRDRYYCIGSLHKDLPFAEEYRQERVKAARKKLGELVKVVSRCKDYEVEGIQG